MLWIGAKEKPINGSLHRSFVMSACLTFLFFFLLTGCTPKPPPENRLVFALESEPERLDPLTIKNPQTFRVAWQIYEGLLGLTEDGRVKPGLAESWETKDYQTWVFKLQGNATFHPSIIFGKSGQSRKVTANDVVWSYTAFCSPGAYASFVLADSLKGCADYNAGKAKLVSGVRALDPHTVEITLLKPEPFFLNRITTAWIAIFPKESSQDTYRDKWGLQLAVGTGPFRLVSRTDTEIVLEKNPNYWDSTRIPNFDKLVFRVIKNSQVGLAELRKGNIDLMPVPSGLFPAVLDTKGVLKDKFQESFILKVFPTFNHHIIGFNLKDISDIHLRRAMSFGTNREEIASQLLYGFADVTGGPVPPSMRGYSPDINQPLYQPERIKAELAKSSYDGKPLEMFVHDLANSERVGEIFQQQMKAIGVNIKLTKLDFGSVIGRVIKGDAPLFGLFAEIVFSSPEPLILNLFSTQKIPVPNFWKYSNTEVDQALEKLRLTPDVSDRLVASSQIEKQIVDDVPAIFLYNEKHALLHNRRVSNLVVNPHEHYQLEVAHVAK